MDEELLEELLELQGECGYWYLASPYTKYRDGIKASFVDTCLMSASLIGNGVNLFSPIVHSHALADNSQLDHYDHRLWMSLDYPMMFNSVGLIVVTMDGWEDSVGVGEEIETFIELSKPIHYVPFDKDCIYGR